MLELGQETSVPYGVSWSQLTMKILTCSECKLRVVPKAEGTCPSCHSQLIRTDEPSIENHVDSHVLQSAVPTSERVEKEARAKSKRAVRVPAIVLVVTSAISMLIDATVFVLSCLDDIPHKIPMQYAPAEAFLVIFSIVGGLGLLFCIHSFILWGAYSMLHLGRFRVARLAAAASVIPAISPLYGVGIPVGIWAFLMLQRKEVRKSFHHE